MAEKIELSGERMPIFITLADHNVLKEGWFSGSYKLIKEGYVSINVFDIETIETDEDSGISYTEIETEHSTYWVKESPQRVNDMIQKAVDKFFGRA